MMRMFMSFCMGCGNELPSDGAFCPKCGQVRHEGSHETSTHSPDGPSYDRDVSSSASKKRSSLPTAAGGVRAQIGQRVDWTQLRLQPAEVRSVVKNAVYALGSVVGLGILLSVLAGWLLGGKEHHGSVVDWTRTGIGLVAAATHGRLTFGSEQFTSTGDADAGGDSGQFLLSAAPIILTVLIFVVVHLWARHAVWKLGTSERWPSLAMLGVVGGATFAVSLTILELAARGTVNYGLPNDSIGAPLSVSGLSWSGLLFSFCIGGLATFTGSASASSATSGNGKSFAKWLGKRRFALRDPAIQAVELFVLTAFTVVVTIAITITVDLIRGGSSLETGLDRSGWTFFGLALLNVLTVIAGAAHGATLSQTGWFTDEGTFGIGDGLGLLAGGVPSWAYLALPAVGICALLIGLRHAVRRSPSTPSLARWWDVPIAYSSLWLIVAILVRVSTSAEGGNLDGDSTAGVLGLGIPSLIISTFAWGALSSLGGRSMARLSAASFPRLTARAAGRGIHPEWKDLIVERVRLEGLKVPQGLATAATETEARPPSATIPLGLGRASYITAVSCGAAILLLLLIPGGNREVCGLPVAAQFKFDKDVPADTPPSTVRSSWSQKQSKVDAASTAAKAAHRSAGKAEKVLQRQTRYAKKLEVATDDLGNLKSDASEAKTAISTEKDVVAPFQDSVDEYQGYYDEFREYDDDGYWIGELRRAKAELADTALPLQKAQRDLAKAQSGIPKARAEVDGLAKKVDDADAELEPDRPLIQAAQDADEKESQLTDDLASAQSNWKEQNDSDQTDATAYNLSASNCRVSALGRSVPAGTLLFAFLGTTLLRNRRRSEIVKS